jgi:hypothetical protein
MYKHVCTEFQIWLIIFIDFFILTQGIVEESCVSTLLGNFEFSFTNSRIDAHHIRQWMALHATLFARHAGVLMYVEKEARWREERSNSSCRKLARL